MNNEKALQAYTHETGLLSQLKYDSREYQVTEQRVLSLLGGLQNVVTNNDIPILTAPLTSVGGEIEREVARTLKVLGTSEAFETVVLIFKAALDNGADEVTAHECLIILESMDADRMQREGLYEYAEENWGNF